jgi:hypothetical protein
MLTFLVCVILEMDGVYYTVKVTGVVEGRIGVVKGA